MPKTLRSYGSPLNLGNKHLLNLDVGDVIIQEKIDGSQISFGRREGKLFVCSRRRDIDLEDPGMFANAVAHIKQMMLVDGWTYWGEYLQKPKHNVLAYNRVPFKNIILFDVETEDGGFFTPAGLIDVASHHDLEVVPCYHIGAMPTEEELKALLENTSVLGDTVMGDVAIVGDVAIEGIVIKNYSQKNKDGNIVKGKLVSKDFREAHDKSKPPKVTEDVVVSVMGGYPTTARWQKALQHLREEGKLTGTPKDIGPLMKEAQQDFEKEEKEVIKELLYQRYRKNLLKASCQGLPDWYKHELAFGGEEHDCTE